MWKSGFSSGYLERHAGVSSDFIVKAVLIVGVCFVYMCLYMYVYLCVCICVCVSPGAPFLFPCPP